jgi:hypothetical protein
MLPIHNTTIVIASKRCYYATIALLFVLHTFPAFFTAIAPLAPLSNGSYDTTRPQIPAIATRLLLTIPAIRTIPNSEAATGK